MKKILLFLPIFFFIFTSITWAEVKEYTPDAPAGRMIPKLPQTPNDPELFNGRVYPFWGPVCQRYTYSVIYKDKEGRPPEYIQIYFNGKMIDMEKENPEDNDYKKGVRYEYKYVPNKLGSNFYYFEASNGLGKVRDSIIDSPDNGPVLFESAFDKNEIALIDPNLGQKVASFPTKEEWIGGIALSDDGKYLAAKTSKHIYLFATPNLEKPLWEFNCEPCMIGGDVKGGVAISGDGEKIIAAIGNRVLLFERKNNQPLWAYETDNSYNVAISRDGRYAGAATAGEESNVNSNLLIFWETKNQKPLWQYHSSGNFHDVSLSQDGQFVAGSTGCPDRKFYLFSRQSNEPLVKTDQLTRDSPVHRAKISADGLLAAVGSESDGGAVFLFSQSSSKPIWQFPTPNGSSVRALNFTPDGNYIGAATFLGDVYLFSKENNQPLDHWQVQNTALGGLDIADDGSFIATGGIDNKVHLFEKGVQTGKEITFNEYVEEIDIAANSKYVAVGTGGSVYFFESFAKDEGKVFPCPTIIEPEPESEMWGQLMNGGEFDGKEGEPVKLPGMLTGFGFIGSTLALGIYFLIIKLKKFPKNKIIIIILATLSGLFLITSIVFAILNKNRPQTQPQTGAEQKEVANPGVCGNELCEPSLGETKESCPKDCSGGGD